VSAVRQIRAEYGVAPGQAVRVALGNLNADARQTFAAELGTISRLAKVSDLHFGESSERVGGHAVLTDGTWVFVPLCDAIDVERECSRLGGEVERLLQLITGQERKLGNQQFTAKAPAAVVDRERDKLASWREQHEVLARKRALLGCADA
jgi:valyl-tRNA synthetase